MAEKKGSGKKKTKKKATKRKKGTSHKRHKAWAKMRKRPDWLPEEVWKASLGPPQGTGHIDRFYFSNCSPDIQIQDIWAAAIPANNDPAEFAFHGPLAPMQNGALMMPFSFETREVFLMVIAEEWGNLYQYDYHCEIPAIYNEYINSLVVGVAKYVRGYFWQSPLFGEMFGHLGTLYQVPASEMIVTPL